MCCGLVGCGGNLGDNAGCQNQSRAGGRALRFRLRLLVTRSPRVIGLAMMLFLLACSAVAPTPEPRAAALQERAEQLFAAINDGRWRAVHSFLTPEFQDICSKREYSAITELGVLTFRTLSHIEGEELQFHVVATAVEADQGKVYSEVLVNGKRLSPGFNAEPEQWVYIDGQWWLQIKAPQRTCSGLG